MQKQENDLKKATEGLKKENDKLVKEVREGQKKVKELGNVQNWAEMLERDFLVLEETLRLANEVSDSQSESSWESGYSDEEGTGFRRGSSGYGDDELESRRRDGEWTLPLLEEMEPEMVDPLAGTPGMNSANGTGTPAYLDGEGDVGMEMSGSGEMEERRLDKGKGRAIESPLQQMELDRHYEEVGRVEHIGMGSPMLESVQEPSRETYDQVSEITKEREKLLNSENAAINTNMKMDIDLDVHEQQQNYTPESLKEISEHQPNYTPEPLIETSEHQPNYTLEPLIEISEHQPKAIQESEKQMDMDAQLTETGGLVHMDTDMDVHLQQPEVTQAPQVDSVVQPPEIIKLSQTEIVEHHSEAAGRLSELASASATTSDPPSSAVHTIPSVHTAASAIS